MDLASLAPTVRRDFQAGLAPATQKSYQAAMRRFEAFCTHFNVTTPFPLTEHLMCCYASFLADEGLAPETIKSYLSALRNMQLSLGFPDPREQSSLPMLKRIQAGIARCRLLRDPPSRIRLLTFSARSDRVTLSGKGSPLGSSLLSLLWFFQARGAAPGDRGGLQSTDEPVMG